MVGLTGLGPASSNADGRGNTAVATTPGKPIALVLGGELSKPNGSHTMRMSPPATFLALSVVLFNNSAEACSCAFTSEIYDSVPADGAQDVPTNAVPWIWAGNTPTLQDADGNLVPTTTAVGHGPFGCMPSVELVPDSPLQPNTTYSVLVQDHDAEAQSEPASISFTTGDGPLRGSAPEKPAVRTAFFNADLLGNACEQPPHQGCVVSEYEGLLDVRMHHSSGYETFLAGRVATVEHLMLGFEDEEVCVEIRARDIAGRTSEAETSCFSTSELPQLSAQGEELKFDGFLSCDSAQLTALLSPNQEEEAIEAGASDEKPPTTTADMNVSAQSAAKSDGPENAEQDGASGCAIAPPTRRTGLLSVGLVGLGLVFAARRRRVRERPTR